MFMINVWSTRLIWDTRTLDGNTLWLADCFRFSFYCNVDLVKQVATHQKFLDVFVSPAGRKE